MSYQVLEQDESWEAQHDRLLISVPIVGSAFKKSYYSSSRGHNVSELVLAQDLVINYFAKSVEECERKTHRIPLSRNEIHERVVRGVYRDVTETEWFMGTPAPKTDPNVARADKRLGIDAPQPDDTTPYRGLEQHVNLDLDGDGYAEPYIITVEEESEDVLRIVTRFEEQDIERIRGQIASIRPIEYFTQYEFIPSPDGGIYGIGFGILLGPLNESVNSIINQLVDAGTMATTAGGFLGRGVKIRGGNYTFAPLEWKRVDSTGDDLQKNIVPLPVREPSNVLLQLLPLLINYTNRVSGANDAMSGENPGQNTPAETTRTMVEQGQKIYNAIFKRIWRSMKGEFKKLFLLNARYLPNEQHFGSGANDVVYRSDYTGPERAIVPAADPNLSSDTMRIQQAMMIKQVSMGTPGYDHEKVEINLLKALKVDGWEQMYPGIQKTGPMPNPKVEIEKIKAQIQEMRIKARMSEIAAKIQSDQELSKAKIELLKAQAAKTLVEAGGAKQAQQLKEIEAQIKEEESKHQSLQGYLELALKGMENQDDHKLGMAGLEAAQSNKAGSQNP
jgi:chaperonin GroES